MLNIGQADLRWSVALLGRYMNILRWSFFQHCLPAHFFLQAYIATHQKCIEEMILLYICEEQRKIYVVASS